MNIINLEDIQNLGSYLKNDAAFKRLSVEKKLFGTYNGINPNSINVTSNIQPELQSLLKEAHAKVDSILANSKPPTPFEMIGSGVKRFVGGGLSGFMDPNYTTPSTYGGALKQYVERLPNALGSPEEMALNFSPMGLTKALPTKVAISFLKSEGRNLTTKFLEYAKGKTTLSRQEIMDFARRPELKKGEADLLNKLAKDLPEGKLPAQEFADSIRRDLLELKPVKVKEPQYTRITVGETTPSEYNLLGKNAGKNYEEVVFESPITTNGSTHYPNSKNYFAHARGDEVVEGGKKIWREQEIQSDLLQKDNLSRQFDPTMGDVLLSERAGKLKARREELAKLDPFTNDRFGERIMRERIKAKAQTGYEKYRLPTGETIGKIEGFQADVWDIVKDTVGKNVATDFRARRATPNDLKVGAKLSRGINADQWIITDILGDGRFKAVPKQIYDRFQIRTNQNFRMSGGRKFTELPKSEQDAIAKAQMEGFTETFDLTGKSNPQYRRYENWGKFLKNKYGAKQITDPQGNSWYEIDLKKEMGKLPIEAFGLVPLLVPKKDDNE